MFKEAQDQPTMNEGHLAVVDSPCSLKEAER
jgi:hypothetical protein